MTKETKQRALRMDLDHQHRPDAFVLWKWRISFAATLLATAYAAWICWPAAAREEAFSPGDVTKVHAALNHKCSECHESFAPIRHDAWGASDPHNRLLADQKCEACHKIGVHQPATQWSPAAAQPGKQEAMCTSCHQEHLGFNASLLMMDDAHCTRCHAQLPESKGPAARKYESHIVSFFPEKSHPEFKSLSGSHSRLWPEDAKEGDFDPGNIKFNHALHMTAGIPSLNPNSKDKWTYARLKQADARAPRRFMLPESDDEALVQLDCRSCHRVRSEIGDKLGEPIELATHSQPSEIIPIDFEQHCRACHALNLNEQRDSAVPHGLQPEALKQAVLGILVPAEPATAKTEKARLTGKLLGKTDALQASEPADLSAQLLAMQQKLKSTVCQECHHYQTTTEAATWIPPVRPANFPTAWLEHARFDHAAHRSLDCRGCHAAAYPESGALLAKKEKLDDQFVMIPNYQKCLECHRPDALSGKDVSKFAGARSDCVECHDYHHAEHGLTAQPVKK